VSIAAETRVEETKHLIAIAYLVAGKLIHIPGSPFKLNARAIPSS
jgi:hypothetical protein